jgi:hypothetical protein
VNVRVNEAWNEVCALSVDYFGFRAFHRRHVSDGGDPVTFDRDSVLPNRPSIHMDDGSVDDDGISRLITQGDVNEGDS